MQRVGAIVAVTVGHAEPTKHNKEENHLRTTLEQLLTQQDWIVLDGATGTMLFEMGLQHGDSPEMWNLEHADRITRLHQLYVDAGSHVILTNTFGGNRLRLGLHNLSERAIEINQQAAQIARAVADQSERGVVVAGSMGPTGSILVPYGEMEFETAVEVFAEQAQGLIQGGVDVIWIETMSDLEEVRAAVEGVRQVNPTFPIVVTMTFDTRGRTMMGVTPEQAIQTLTPMNLTAIGGNCGNGIDGIVGVMQKMSATGTTVPLIAKSNAGIPKLIKGVAVYDASPADMATYATTVKALGVKIIGGCCGTTPQHIAAMVATLQ